MRVVSTRYITPPENAKGNTNLEKEIIYEGSAGPRELLENLWRQVKAARRAMENSKPDPNAKSVNSLLHLTKAKDTEEVERLEAFWYEMFYLKFCHFFLNTKS